MINKLERIKDLENKRDKYNMTKITVKSVTDRENIVAKLKESTPIATSIIEIGGEEKKINIYNVLLHQSII